MRKLRTEVMMTRRGADMAMELQLRSTVLCGYLSRVDQVIPRVSSEKQSLGWVIEEVMYIEDCARGRTVAAVMLLKREPKFSRVVKENE